MLDIYENLCIFIYFSCIFFIVLKKDNLSYVMRFSYFQNNLLRNLYSINWSFFYSNGNFVVYNNTVIKKFHVHVLHVKSKTLCHISLKQSNLFIPFFWMFDLHFVIIFLFYFFNFIYIYILLLCNFFSRYVSSLFYIHFFTL